MKRILTSVAALSLSVAAIIGVPSPALAHSDEVKTSPAAGATVDAGRIPITLTFGEELLTGDDSISHEVIVTNEAGEIVPALCASAEGFELSTAAALTSRSKTTPIMTPPPMPLMVAFTRWSPLVRSQPFWTPQSNRAMPTARTHCRVRFSLVQVLLGCLR